MKIGNRHDHFSVSSVPLCVESPGLEVSRDMKGGDGGKPTWAGEHR